MFLDRPYYLPFCSEPFVEPTIPAHGLPEPMAPIHGLPEPMVPAHGLPEPRVPAHGLPEPMVPIRGLPEPTVDVTLPETTYARLVAAKAAMNAASIEKAVERLATW